MGATPISYELKITQAGLLSLSFSTNGGVAQPILTNQSIIAGNGPLPATFRFGFAASIGGETAHHEISCFRAAPAEFSSTSAAVNIQQSGEVRTGSQIYLSFFHTANWWGQITSQDLLYDAGLDTVRIAPTANWDASCVLSGGNCGATGVNGMVAQDPNARTILTWNPGSGRGIPFRWASLTLAQRTALTAGDADPVNDSRLNYLRGDRSNERRSDGTGLYRKRSSVLADVIESSPTWAGPPSAPYPDAWSDKRYPGATPAENAQTYAAFVAAKKTRQHVVYSGANDGILHGYRAGAFNAAGDFVNNASFPNDGREVLAYMPATVLERIHDGVNPELDYANPQYSHIYGVNATPEVGDLYYGGEWHTWLVGGLGEGGKAIYALDITNPANFLEAEASSLVKFELTPASITTQTCVNRSSDTNCGANLGKTYGTPQIRRFHNGRWGVVFGNGLQSETGKAGIYIVTVGNGGATSIYYLDTGSGTVGTPSGISFVTPVDLDGDHITDFVYAADIRGKVWRFDLTSNRESDWAVSRFGGASATPLFTTDGAQPVSTRLIAALTADSRLVISFGTGNHTPLSTSGDVSYAAGQHRFYGIWDWDMGAWNTGAEVPMKTLAGSRSIAVNDLQEQTILQSIAADGTNGISGYRTTSKNTVDWCTDTPCRRNTKYGWYMTLPAAIAGQSGGEQVIYSPILSQSAFIVNTIVPAANSPLSCVRNPNSGWTMALSPETGASFTESFFANRENQYVLIGGNSVSGAQLSAVGSPSVVTAGGKPYLVSQTGRGTGQVTRINPPTPPLPSPLPRRKSWKVLM